MKQLILFKKHLTLCLYTLSFILIEQLFYKNLYIKMNSVCIL